MFLPVLGDIGGNMGLFLGCSLLSLFEFVDLLWDILDSRTNRSKSIPEEQTDNGSAWNNRRKSSNQQFFRICERWTSKKPLYSLRFPSIRKSERSLVDSLSLESVFLDRVFGRVLRRRKRYFSLLGLFELHMDNMKEDWLILRAIPRVSREG